jgi:pentatricopeptide repeat protein
MLESWTKFLNLFDQLKSNGQSPNSRDNVLLIAGFCEAGNSVRVVGLVREMEERGIYPYREIHVQL